MTLYYVMALTDGLGRGGCSRLGLRAELAVRRGRPEEVWCWFVGEGEEGGWMVRRMPGAAGPRAVAFCSL